MKPFENILKLGDEGPLVSDLQARLIQLGFTSCYIEDGKSVGLLDVPTGCFGEITQELLSDFQAKVFDNIVIKSIPTPVDLNHLNIVTGEMNFETWYVLNNYEALSEFYKTRVDCANVPIPKDEPKPEPELEAEPIIPVSKKLIQFVIQLAKGEKGVVEHGGNNYGKRVEEYQSVGSNSEVDGGQPWCQYFMNWLLIRACQSNNTKYKLHYSGYTPFWVNYGKEKKITLINPKMEEIEVGDFMYVYSASRNNAKHVALIIAKNTNGTVTTIEGNTNDGGGSDGFGVFQRVRPRPWAVVKWHKLY